MNFIDKIAVSDSLKYLRQLPKECVNCCVTSPPYYGLRDYGMAEQIGLEETPDAYIARLVEIFREVRSVLKSTGTLWVNIGDSYAGSDKGAWLNKDAPKEVYSPNPGDLQTRMPKTWDGIKPKDLIGVPWMLAFALRSDGWYLRQDIIWSKPNGMPESVRDRCGKSHEYIFLLSKLPRYYFDVDAIKTPAKESTLRRVAQDLEWQAVSARTSKTNGTMKAVIGGRKRQRQNDALASGDPMKRSNSFREYEYTPNVNKRSVWEVPTTPFKEAHFAVYPEKLIVDCVKAGCPENGVVLDPFMGGGTTAVVARKLNRHFIGCELNPEYVKIAEKRLKNEIGLFL